MQTLREVIGEYQAAHKALGHFNFSDSNQLKAIAEASKETGIPVVAGLSEGEREYFPLAHARALVDAYQAQGVAIYFNADHTYSVEKVERAIASGVDSVVVDGAKLPFEENVHLLTTCVKYARASGRDVLVEGELGYIGSSSKVMDMLPEGAAATEAMMTTPEDAKKFIEATGVDAFAPAVGNVHGMVKGGNPKLSIERITAIAAAVSVPLVLHGGSGVTDAEFKAAVAAGITLIHINTEFRVLYRQALEQSFKDNPDEVAPYKFLAPVGVKLTDFLAGRMRLFAGE